MRQLLSTSAARCPGLKNCYARDPAFRLTSTQHAYACSVSPELFYSCLQRRQAVIGRESNSTSSSPRTAADSSNPCRKHHVGAAGSPAKPVVIHIKPGTYKELIYIQHEKRFFHLIGEDAEKTILTFDLHANMIGRIGKPIGTFRTPSTVIDADDVTAENLTFENSRAGGPGSGDSRGWRSRASSGTAGFWAGRTRSFLNRGRQYFEDCYIAGHVDFIFGAATAWFERCHIHCLRTAISPRHRRTTISRSGLFSHTARLLASRR